jgi:hypothetical protein
MIVISSTGGSGSSFVAKQFKSRGWTVCLRPDGGKQKATHTPSQIFHQRMDHLIGGNAIYEKSTQEQMFKTAYKGLKENDSPNLMLLCMTWGGLGYLNDIEEKTIFLIRDPIFAFNSYSGGGWREEGGQRRIKYIEATGPNDKKWIDAWMGDFSHWLDGAKYALQAHKEGKGHIVRYNKFKEDWAKLKNVPPIHLQFNSKDDLLKIQQKGYLDLETVAYIRSKTREIWSEIQAL